MIKISNTKIICGECGHENINKNSCDKCGKTLIKTYNVNELYPKELKACDYCGIRTENINIEDGINNKIFICNECKEKGGN